MLTSNKDLFYDKVSIKYYKSKVSKEYKKKRLNFIKKMKKSKNSKVLDIGCGVGKDLKLFREYNIVAYGIDNNNKMISASITNNPELRENIFKGDFFKYNFDKLKFDSIWSISFLQVIDNINKCNTFAKKCFQITKSNAILFISTPFFVNLKINEVSKIFRKEHSMYENFMNIDHELLTSSFIKNGFKLIKHSIYETSSKNKIHNEYLLQRN